MSTRGRLVPGGSERTTEDGRLRRIRVDPPCGDGAPWRCSRRMGAAAHRALLKSTSSSLPQPPRERYRAAQLHCQGERDITLAPGWARQTERPTASQTADGSRPSVPSRPPGTVAESGPASRGSIGGSAGGSLSQRGQRDRRRLPSQCCISHLLLLRRGSCQIHPSQVNTHTSQWSTVSSPLLFMYWTVCLLDCGFTMLWMPQSTQPLTAAARRPPASSCALLPAAPFSASQCFGLWAPATRQPTLLLRVLTSRPP